MTIYLILAVFVGALIGMVGMACLAAGGRCDSYQEGYQAGHAFGYHYGHQDGFQDGVKSIGEVG